MPNSGGIKFGKGERQHVLKPTAGGTQHSCSHCSPEKKNKQQSDTQVFQRVGMLRGPGWSDLELINGIIFSVL